MKHLCSTSGWRSVEHTFFLRGEANGSGGRRAQVGSRLPLAMSTSLPSTTLLWVSAETITYIIKLSLPAKRFSSFVERYKILLACSLVNRTWRELGQAELFRDVALWNSPRAVKFLAALEGTGWGPRVRSLRFGHREREGAWTKSNTGSDNFVDSFVLGKVLRATPEAETV